MPAGNVICGVCPTPQVCYANKVCAPKDPICTPKTTASCTIVCGPEDDGCGGILNCGKW